MISQQELIDKLAIAVRSAGSQSQFARNHKLQPSDINAVLRGRRPPTMAIASALGYRRTFAYEPSRGANAQG